MSRQVNGSHELLDSPQITTKTMLLITSPILPPTLGIEPQSISQLRASENSSNSLPETKTSPRKPSRPVLIQDITSEAPIYFHKARSKYYLVKRQRCRCGKSFNSKPELSSPAGHSESCRWLEAWATNRRVAEKFGVEIIGATASWYEERKKCSNRSANSSRQAWHESELSSEWDLSWTTQSKFEEMATIKEIESRRGLENEQSVLGSLQQRMDATQDPELWQEINGQFTAIQENIPGLIDAYKQSQTHRTAAETLVRYFLVHCELHPNQFVPSRYLPEQGLVDHESLALLRNALNQAKKANTFGRRDLWLCHLIATRLSDEATPCLSQILRNLPQEIQKIITKEDGPTIIVEQVSPVAEIDVKGKKRKEDTDSTDSRPLRRQKGRNFGRRPGHTKTHKKTVRREY